MANAREAETIRRRLRRLTAMQQGHSVERANNALRMIWDVGRKPTDIVVRSALLQEPAGRPALARLVLPKGVALRWYLLAIFEAHCRLAVGDAWTNTRPLSGLGSWSDLVAIDGAYDTDSQKYMPDTKQGRTLEDLRLRQIHGALKTLADLGDDEALVEIPRNGSRRTFADFSLMVESGRGNLPTPDRYTVPGNHWSAARITVPPEFFLKGWVQVLNPSEIATWFVLRGMSQWAAATHAETGVYLYGEGRTRDFGIKRDAWQDGCQRLREFGLIRYAQIPQADAEVTGPEPDGSWTFLQPAQPVRPKRYEPYRWQMQDEGLGEDAVAKCIKELTIRQKDLGE